MQLPPRKIDQRTISPEDNCPRKNYPLDGCPQTIATKDNCPQRISPPSQTIAPENCLNDNYPTDNRPPKKNYCSDDFSPV